MYNDNPSDESKSYSFYLNPDSQSINCDKGKSDFNHLVIHKKDFGKNQYLEIDFTNQNFIKLSVDWPSDDLTVKEIRSFAEDGIKEYLNLK